MPQELLHHLHCMQQVHSWTWRAVETVEMRHKTSKQLSRLAGSQKQQSSHEACLAYSRALEIHTPCVNRWEEQNICDGNQYCVGWARRINTFHLLPLASVAARPNWFQ